MTTKRTDRNSGKKPSNKEKVVRVNVSLSPATNRVLKAMAKHKDLSVAAVVTSLIRCKAEDMGIIAPPKPIKLTDEGEVIPPLAALNNPRKKANGTD